VPLILFALATAPSSELSSLPGNTKLSTTALGRPVPQLVTLPTTAFVASPVVATVMAPERFYVTTNHAMGPAEKPSQREKSTARVDFGG
jgi:hypothetical protein